METTTAAPAESSPAQSTQATEQKSVSRFETLTGEQRQEYFKTGEVTKKEPVKEDSATSQVQEQETSAAKTGEETQIEAETAADSETASTTQETQQRKRPTASDRVQELLVDRKRLDARVAELEAQLSGKAQPSKEVQQSSARTETAQKHHAPKPNPKDTDEQGNLKFKTWEEVEDAVAEWTIKEAEYRIEAKNQREAQQKTMNEKVTAGRERYKDFDKTVIPAVEAISNNPKIAMQVKQALNRSENLVDVMYVLGEPKALADFMRTAETDPIGAITKIAILGVEVAKELGKTEKPNVPPAKKTVTDAPPPPQEVGGKGTTSADPEETAVKERDFRSYKAIADRKDIARRKGL